MNPKHFLIGFLALGVFALAYENYKSPEHAPHLVQDTTGKTGEPLASVSVPELSERAKAGKIFGQFLTSVNGGIDSHENWPHQPYLWDNLDEKGRLIASLNVLFCDLAKSVAQLVSGGAYVCT